MSTECMVTVLIPSYNHARYLKQRIESVLNQTYKNVELIIIDDCSTDGSDTLINSYLNDCDFKYIRNSINTGTPFSAWNKITKLADGEFIWICESDDYADPRFLEVAVAKFAEVPEAVLFYCNSWIIDENDQAIGHTSDYFHDIWKETRWDKDFIANGQREIMDFQQRGQTVPNMSSALIKTSVFIKAFDTYLERFKLTGDWLFIGWVMKFGDVIFCSETLNYYRKHEMTARIRVKSAQSQAEFMLTKYKLFKETKLELSDFAGIMAVDFVRFIYEPASTKDVIRALFDISALETISYGSVLLWSILINPSYVRNFYERYKSTKENKNE